MLTVIYRKRSTFLPWYLNFQIVCLHDRLQIMALGRNFPPAFCCWNSWWPEIFRSRKEQLSCDLRFSDWSLACCWQLYVKMSLVYRRPILSHKPKRWLFHYQDLCQYARMIYNTSQRVTFLDCLNHTVLRPAT